MDGTYTVDNPATAATTLGIADGAIGAVTANINAQINATGILTATYRVVVLNTVPQGVSMVNTATATGEDGSGNSIPGNNPDVGDNSDGDTEDPDADDTGIASIPTMAPGFITDKTILAINDNTGNKTQVEVGDVVRYQYIVTNIGGGDAQNIQIQDIMPDGFSYVNGSTSASWPLGTSTSNPSSSGQTLTWNLNATLLGGDPSGETLTIQYKTLVTKDVADSGNTTFKNIASVTGKDLSGGDVQKPSLDPDDDDLDDQDDEEVSILLPFITLDKQTISIDEDVANTRVAKIGSIIAYKITVKNTGTGTAYNVIITDTPPGDWELISGKARTVVNKLSAGQSVTVNLTYQVKDTAVNKEDYINTAKATDTDKLGNPLQDLTDKESIDIYTQNTPDNDLNEFVPKPSNFETNCCLSVEKFISKIQPDFDYVKSKQDLYFRTDIAMFAATELYLYSKEFFIEQDEDFKYFEQTAMSGRNFSLLNYGNVSFQSGIGLPLWFSENI